MLQPHYAWNAATYYVDDYLYIHIITHKYYYPACLCIVFRIKYSIQFNTNLRIQLIIEKQLTFAVQIAIWV